MSRDIDRSTFDRDLDIPSRRAPAPEDSELEPYRRLVANPFLAILGWLAAIGICRLALRARHPWFLLIALGLFAASFSLFQFHCLDCGKTGFLHRHRRHLCDPLYARWQGQDQPRWRPPGVKSQLLAWFCLIIAATILIAAAFRGRH